MSFLNSREALAPRGIGKSVPRREDSRLLTGRGRYANDFSLPGQAYAYLVRSPHAPHRSRALMCRGLSAAVVCSPC
jgi:CO/xanthine dehydrogenase Mo-binding subunit